MPRYSNANSFAQGVGQGLYFMGGMIDLMERKETRQRKHDREDRNEARTNEIHGLTVKRQQTSNDAAAFGLRNRKEDRLSNAPVRTGDIATKVAKNKEFADRAPLRQQMTDNDMLEQGNRKTTLGIQRDLHDDGTTRKVADAGAREAVANADSAVSDANVQTSTESDQIKVIELARKTAEEKLQRLKDKVGEKKVWKTPYGDMTLKEIDNAYKTYLKSMKDRTDDEGNLLMPLDFDPWFAELTQQQPKDKDPLGDDKRNKLGSIFNPEKPKGNARSFIDNP
ncbi:hypothetical protein KAR91_40075 [Candidatus Pacearchaeota archaeon]|nr:hypothetical protein [Candidatus Pacearchaeota archaeon]